MTVITTCRLLPRGRRGIVRRVQSSALIRINSRREMRAMAINAVPAGNDAGRYGLEFRRMREIAFGSIDRLQSRMILLGRSRALERVCGFLLEFAHRVQVEAERTVALPMSRYCRMPRGKSLVPCRGTE